MKRFILLLCLVLGFLMGAQAQKCNPNVIIGKYLSEGKKAKIQIFKHGNRFYGKLIWTITPGKLDSKNPNPKERSKKMVGKQILNNFVFDGDDTWEGGTIYDPISGKTYSCKITRDSSGALKIRGFIGISLFGRTTVWQRIR